MAQAAKYLDSTLGPPAPARISRKLPWKVCQFFLWKRVLQIHSHQQHQQSRQPPAPVHSPQHPNADIHTTTSEATTPIDLSSPTLTHGPAHHPHTVPPSAPEPSKTNSFFTHLTSKLTLQSQQPQPHNMHGPIRHSYTPPLSAPELTEMDSSLL